jgi:hypothetical protein
MLTIFGFTPKFCTVAKLVTVGIQLLDTEYSYVCQSLTATALRHRQPASAGISRDSYTIIRYIFVVCFLLGYSQASLV